MIQQEDWHAVQQTLPMTCTCDPDGQADAARRRQEATRRLESFHYVVDDAMFLTQIVGSLEHDLGGWFIGHIACDMWFGASVYKYGVRDGKSYAEAALTVQGDTAEDCLVELYLEAARLHDEKTSTISSVE